MFRKIVLVSLTALFINYLCGDKATDIILNIFKAAFHSSSTVSQTVKVFSKDDLKSFNGIDKPELYLAILGNVFDVTKGGKHYGPNKQYNIFVGRDGSRSFVTGEFSEENIKEDVIDFNPEELRSLKHWLKFYEKEYTKVGVVIGKYFDEYGQETSYSETVRNFINEAEKTKQRNDLEKSKFPPCNVEWDEHKGTRVWCSEKSGGIEREWSGVPRQLYEPGSKTYRCACIDRSNEKLGVIKEYEGCDEKSISCFVKQN